MLYFDSRKPAGRNCSMMSYRTSLALLSALALAASAAASAAEPTGLSSDQVDLECTGDILFNRNEKGAWTMRIDRRTGACSVHDQSVHGQ
jgi:hypothetical protein